jgi:hypothetical protein
MASVYKAFDEKLRRHVAIKELSEQFRDNEDVCKLFLSEARKMALVRHQNVVQVYDIYEDGVPTIIMEYMGGGSLATRVGTGNLPPDIVLNIIREVGIGLRAIHDAGLVHRDIKPENILEEGGKYKITDFGVAITGEEEALPFVTNKYAAPEVLTDPSRIGPSSDIYSLGIMAAELLLGPRRFEQAVREAIEQDSEIQVPAIRNSVQAFWQQWVASDAELPPLNKIDESIPEEVAGFLVGIMRRNRSERFNDCRTFIKDLDKVIEQTGERASAPTEYSAKMKKRLDKTKAAKAEPEPAKKRKPLWFKVTAGLGITLLLAIAVLFLLPSQAPRYYFAVTTEPPGATVLVNGEPVESGTTPTRISASWGDAVSVEVEGGETRELTMAEGMEGLSIVDGAYQLAVTLVPTLSIESSEQAMAYLRERMSTPWPVTAAVPDAGDADPLLLAIGTELTFDVTSEQPGSLLVLHLSADNYAMVIYPVPNGFAPQLEAGQTANVGEELRLVTREPLGQEWLAFIVSDGLGDMPAIEGAALVNDMMHAYRINGSGSPGQAFITWLADAVGEPNVSGTILAIEIVAAGDES